MTCNSKHVRYTPDIALSHLFIGEDGLVLVHIGHGPEHQEELGLAGELGLLVQHHVGGDVSGVDETLGRSGN